MLSRLPAEGAKRQPGAVVALWMRAARKRPKEATGALPAGRAAAAGHDKSGYSAAPDPENPERRGTESKGAKGHARMTIRK